MGHEEGNDTPPFGSWRKPTSTKFCDAIELKSSLAIQNEIRFMPSPPTWARFPGHHELLKVTNAASSNQAVVINRVATISLFVLSFVPYCTAVQKTVSQISSMRFYPRYSSLWITRITVIYCSFQRVKQLPIFPYDSHGVDFRRGTEGYKCTLSELRKNYNKQ